MYYYDPKHPAGFGGTKKLKEATGAPVEDWLKKQLAYTLHKPLRRNYPTRSYKTSGINELWQLDLTEMIPYAKVNKGYKYILTCIDVFSRFGRAIPLKSKKGEDVAKALATIFNDNIPFYIQTDLGKEFYNSHVKKILTKHGVRHYSVYSQFKAALVERWNRTLRERLNRYFTYRGKKQWHDALDDIVYSYNHSKHRGIQYMRPVDVNVKNEAELWSKQEQQQQPTVGKTIQLLDYVRVSRNKGPFLKNFDQNWSDEVFRVIAIDTKQTPVMYTLQDLQGSVIQGKFYMQELQSIGSEPPQLYRIQKILRTYGKGKYKQYYVKWVDYDSSHNSWIKANQINQ